MALNHCLDLLLAQFGTSRESFEQFGLGHVYFSFVDADDEGWHISCLPGIKRKLYDFSELLARIAHHVE